MRGSMQRVAVADEHIQVPVDSARVPPDNAVSTCKNCLNSIQPKMPDTNSHAD